MTEEELIYCYQDTGAVEAANLPEWSKEKLLGVRDEIEEEAAKKLLAHYGPSRKR